MLFNSLTFICAFLPFTLLGFYAIGWVWGGRGWGAGAAKAWLVGASLFFYGYWSLNYLPLFVISVLVNYAFGCALVSVQKGAKKPLLVAGLVFNLALLGYFKYANFFVETLNLAGFNFNLANVILPLAISFYTFQQIAYLVDAYRDDTKRYTLLDYALFVLFFPQLIAGPIVHPQEVLPQFRRASYRFRADDFSVGVTLFLLGLAKKVLIADSVARFATPVFGAAAAGAELSLLEAWGGALAYTLQLYFDFSGYSDMAIGLARMFGVRLPLNFNSPYKATNIVDFWRRWHITLSRWLRDYLYIPLGGNRKGALRRHANLLLTMLLGGLWHGAGWTFVFWGGLHGLYLTVCHSWGGFIKRTGTAHLFDNVGGRVLSRGLTFGAVVVGWVFFRAESWDAAVRVLEGMVGLNGLSLPSELAGGLAPLSTFGVLFNDLGAFDARGLVWIAVLLVVVWCAPNPEEWMSWTQPTLEPLPAPRRPWQPTVALGLLGGLLFFVVMRSFFTLTPTEFLYFNF